MNHEANSSAPVQSEPIISPRADKRALLDSFFLPRSVAVIGATDRAGTVGCNLLSNLLQSKFLKKMYAVNPAHEEVFGLKTRKNIGEIEDEVDLAVIVTPASTVPKIIGDCVNARVKSAVVISAGFREQGPRGARLEEEIQNHLRRGSLRLLGPNCMGFMNPTIGLNATFSRFMPQQGSVAFLSQSGALQTAILDWSRHEQVGFSAIVSTGSMIDVGWGDLIYHFGDDPHTKCILLYMESVGEARSFLAAASAITLSKPIIALKAGRSEAASRAAASHTGAPTGSDEVFDAAFRRCGVLRVHNMADLFYMAEVLSKQPRPRGPKLAIVTNAGGPGVLATDALVAAGGELATLSNESLGALAEFLSPHWSRSNPVDVLADANPECFVKAVDIALQDSASDGLLAIVAPQGLADPTEVAERMKPYAHSSGKPVLTSWMGADAVAAGTAVLNSAGIPTFSYPDTAARAFTYMWRYTYNLRGLYETPALVEDPHPREGDAGRLDELIQGARSRHRSLLNEFESKQLLAHYGIPVVETRAAQSEQESVRGDGYELMIGSSVDEQFGPVIVFGSGGVRGELYKDRALALPPLNTTLAQRLMEQTRIYAALQGNRGCEPVDITKIEEVLVRFSRLVIEQPWIKKIDINPLLATSEQVRALDARVQLHDPTLVAARLPRPALRPYPAHYIHEGKLRDGTALTIRPIRPEDEPLMIRFHQKLSERSVYLRYFYSLSLSARVEHERLVRICFAGYDRGFALVADRSDAETGEHEILGVGRFTALNSVEAEVAVLVADLWQRRGLGTELLSSVVQVARSEGFQRLWGEILRDNLATQAVFKKVGFSLKAMEDPSSLSAGMEL